MKIRVSVPKIWGKCLLKSYLLPSIFLSPESKYNLWVDTLVLRKMNNCISKRITQDQEKLVKSFVKPSLTEIPLPLSYDQENMIPVKPKWWSGQKSSKSWSLMSIIYHSNLYCQVFCWLWLIFHRTQPWHAI